eukprot:2552644-Alexandrium_andersonii.AAC.1
MTYEVLSEACPTKLPKGATKKWRLQNRCTKRRQPRAEATLAAAVPPLPLSLARMLVNTRRCPETHMHPVMVYGRTGISWFGARHACYCTFRG